MHAEERLKEGNARYQKGGGDALRVKTATEGQHPYAVVICCSDSRVIPERIFDADIGDLFVVRVAGNVLDPHQLGSIEYAVAHLGTKLVLMLGHTGCGAVKATIEGHSDAFISFITDEIRRAIGMERDPDAACRMNVRYNVDKIRAVFAEHAAFRDVQVRGAVYDIASGAVEWL